MQTAKKGSIAVILEASTVVPECKKMRLYIKPRQRSNNHEVHEDHEEKISELSSSTFVVFVVR